MNMTYNQILERIKYQLDTHIALLDTIYSYIVDTTTNEDLITIWLDNTQVGEIHFIIDVSDRGIFVSFGAPIMF